MKTADSPYRAVYINLDRSKERRSRMAHALRALPADIPVSRFPAVEVATGRGALKAAELGCCLSNLAVLEAAGEDRHLLVFEDDVVFSPDVATGLQAASHYLDSGTVDLLFLGQTVQFDDIAQHRRMIAAWSEAERSGSFLALRADRNYRWGSFAYAVAKQSARRIGTMLRNALDAEEPEPLDLFYRRQITTGKIRAAVLVPYIAGVDPSIESTMVDRGFAVENDLHFQLVNLYMRGGAPANEVDAWNALLSEGANPHALAIARMVYQRIAMRGRDPKQAQG
jgi:GR25 family glycosyltransferase involved in LPS biosynthesis